MKCCVVLSLVAQSCLTLCDPRSVAHQASLSMGILQANTGVGNLSLLQENFPTQESNQGLLLLQVDSLPAMLPGKPASPLLPCK